jgi:hypothetical protein
MSGSAGEFFERLDFLVTFLAMKKVTRLVRSKVSKYIVTFFRKKCNNENSFFKEEIIA